jgi:oxygen-dependent protoporphyrinogen oxidase
MQTHAFPSLGGFWIEAGSHSCFNSYGNLLEIMERLDLLERQRPRPSRATSSGATANARRSSRRCTCRSCWSRCRGCFRSPNPSAASRILWPRARSAQLSRPVRSGLSLGHLPDGGRLSGRGPVSQKAAPQGCIAQLHDADGLSEIPMAIAAKIRDSGRIRPHGDRHCGSAMASSCVSKTALNVLPHLTLAVPPDVAARLLADVAPDAASIIGASGGRDRHLLLAFDKADLGVAEMAGLISVDGPFLSAVSRDFMADARYRGFAFHFPGGASHETERISAAVPRSTSTRTRPSLSAQPATACRACARAIRG